MMKKIPGNKKGYDLAIDVVAALTRHEINKGAFDVSEDLLPEKQH